MTAISVAEIRPRARDQLLIDTVNGRFKRFDISNYVRSHVDNVHIP